MTQTLPSYEELVAQIGRLPATEQAQLLQDLAAIVGRQLAPRPRRSILELEGLGAEVWAGIDVKEYLRQERDSWNG